MVVVALWLHNGGMRNLSDALARRHRPRGLPLWATAVDGRGALPRLRQQVLHAQSARIDGVSGTTVTSDGYRESLQAALDAAHFG